MLAHRMTAYVLKMRNQFTNRVPAMKSDNMIKSFVIDFFLYVYVCVGTFIIIGRKLARAKCLINKFKLCRMHICCL